MVRASLADLETKGFVVIPGFLSADEVDAYRQDFETRPLAGNANYRVRHASPDANRRFSTRVGDVLQAVAAQTAMRPDAPQGATYFATARGTGINFPWHQDHESFFETQNHFDYLNFYVPIVKPLRDKSNLSVVPFDALERAAPRLFRHLVLSGATRFGRLGAMRFAVCDDSGHVRRVLCDFEAIAETPNLAAGDLLLMRGDIVHRTQDVETARVALSFRVAKARTPVTRKGLAGGGYQKTVMMCNNPEAYERMFRAFDEAGTDVLPFEDLRERAARVDIGDGLSGKRFFAFLMMQKLRTGTVTRFLWSATVLQMLGLWASAYAFYLRRRAGGGAGRGPTGASTAPPAGARAR